MLEIDDLELLGCIMEGRKEKRLQWASIGGGSN